jgi:hypothetical protein
MYGLPVGPVVPGLGLGVPGDAAEAASPLAQLAADFEMGAYPGGGGVNEDARSSAPATASWRSLSPHWS